MFLSLFFKFPEVNCGAPPVKPSRGTIHWRGKSNFRSEAKYRCRPYAKFRNATGGGSYDEATVRCQWNKKWSAIEDECVGETYIKTQNRSLKTISNTLHFHLQLHIAQLLTNRQWSQA